MRSLESFSDICHDRDRSALKLTAKPKVSAQRVHSGERINVIDELSSLLPRFQIFKGHGYGKIEVRRWLMGYHYYGLWRETFQL